MTRLRSVVLASLGLAGSLAATGCDELECAPGTRELDGACLADDTQCAPGTVRVDAECVPDGSVICGDGTAYDAELGQCVPDDDACAMGTVLVDGVCVPDDATLTADADEAAEPNGLNDGDGLAGEIVLPDVGDDGFVLHGCVEPFEDVDANGELDADHDAWLLEVDGPTLLDVTADGVGGLAAGFMVFPAGDMALSQTDWTRFGMNLTGDTSARQLFLPEAGLYVLAMTDSRSLFLDAAGGAGQCYYTTVKQLALPTPIAVASGVETGTMTGEVIFYRHAAADGDLVDANLTTPSEAYLPSLVMMRNDAYHRSNDDNPAEVQVGGMAAADDVVLVVDARYAYGLTAAAWTLTSDFIAASALPADGGAATATSAGAFDRFGDLGFLFFDARAGDLINLDLAFDQDVDFLIVDSDLDLVTVESFPDDGAGNEITAFDDWVRFETAGRYYVVVFRPGGGDVEVTGARTAILPTALTLGTAVDDQAASALGADWFTVDLTSAIWIALTAGASDFGGDVAVTAYMIEPGLIGRPDQDFDGDSFTMAADGSGAFGRVVLDLDRVVLLRIADDGAPGGADPTFDLAVSNRVFTDLGSVSQTAAIAADAVAVVAAETERFLVRAGPGAVVTIAVAGGDGLDPVIELLDENESVIDGVNDTGADAAETIEVTVTQPTWIAFQVTDAGGNPGSFDLDVTSVDPVPYAVTSGNLTFSDACASGTVVAMGDDDDLSGNLALPFAFELFGDAVTDVNVSSNGWATLDSGYVGGSQPGASSFPDLTGPNGVLGPMWEDLAGVEVCTLATGTTFTIQWTGIEPGFPPFFPDVAVQFQAVLHDDGVIDYVYGPDHDADGSAASIGAENLNGGFGHQLGEFEPDTALGGTSYTLTPAP